MDYLYLSFFTLYLYGIEEDLKRNSFQNFKLGYLKCSPNTLSPNELSRNKLTSLTFHFQYNTLIIRVPIFQTMTETVRL